jgi:hypothetical protein
MFVFDSYGRDLEGESVSELCVGGMGNWVGRKDEDVLLEGNNGENRRNGEDGADVRDPN